MTVGSGNEWERPNINKAGDLVTRAYHEKSIQDELRKMPDDQRRDIINKMIEIDKKMHEIGGSAGLFPSLVIERADKEIRVGVKGAKLKEFSLVQRFTPSMHIEKQKITHEKITDSDGQPGTHWL